MSMAWRICASAKCPMRHFALDHGRVAHAGNAAGRADVGGDALERHNGRGSGGLGDAGLLGGGDVHDDAAFQHLGEPAVQGHALGGGRRGGAGRLIGGGGGGRGGDVFGHEGSFRSQKI